MDLLTNLENSGEALRQNAVAPASNVQPMDFLQKLGVCPSNPTEMATNKADSRCVALCVCFFFFFECIERRVNFSIFYLFLKHEVVFDTCTKECLIYILKIIYFVV